MTGAKSLLSSVLTLQDHEIVDLEIKNPITPGERINEKKFIMNI